jgi:hypothetical protein
LFRASRFHNPGITILTNPHFLLNHQYFLPVACCNIFPGFVALLIGFFLVFYVSKPKLMVKSMCWRKPLYREEEEAWISAQNA